MKKLVIALAFGFMILSAINVTAAETKVQGRVYSHWMMDMTDGADSYNEFDITRTYVTIKSKLSDFTSVRITTDIRQTEQNTSEFNGYEMILKYAYLDWQPKFGQGNVTLRMGLQPTLYIDNMNGIWGRRYMMKTIGDEESFLTTADMGAGLQFNLGEKGKYGMAGINVWNGTKYTNLEELNKNKDFSGFVAFNPFTNNNDLKNSQLIAQYYYGVQNREFAVNEDASDYNRNLLSVGGIMVYRNIFDFGADLNWYSEGQGAGNDDEKQTGFSFFGTLYLESLAENAPMFRTLNLFGRVDMYDPNTDLDNNADTRIVGGVECAPIKGVKASVNLRSISFEDDATDSETYLYVNTLVKF